MTEAHSAASLMNQDLPPTRLAREFQRLFLTTPASAPDTAARTRALVLELTGPSAWQPLAAVWRGLQADLGLPAPAISVNGTDGLQLWFSLLEAVDVPVGRALLEQLRLRYLADVPPHRVVMRVDAIPVAVPRQMPGPADADADSRWSAFVAADLAPVFEETPWLDLPPSEEGQADLLSRVVSAGPAALSAALDRLQPLSAAVPSGNGQAGLAGASGAAPSAAHPAAAQFLLEVMQDPTAPLALRVEAAKALLPYAP
jgi:hypothetical protein